jgi:hypothetical protein
MDDVEAGLGSGARLTSASDVPSISVRGPHRHVGTGMGFRLQRGNCHAERGRAAEVRRINRKLGSATSHTVTGPHSSSDSSSRIMSDNSRSSHYQPAVAYTSVRWR